MTSAIILGYVFLGLVIVIALIKALLHFDTLEHYNSEEEPVNQR